MEKALTPRLLTSIKNQEWVGSFLLRNAALWQNGWETSLSLALLLVNYMTSDKLFHDTG